MSDRPNTLDFETYLTSSPEQVQESVLEISQRLLFTFRTQGWGDVIKESTQKVKRAEQDILNCPPMQKEKEAHLKSKWLGMKELHQFLVNLPEDAAEQVKLARK